MANSGHILVINPGSTSTKLALYHFDISKASLALIQKVNLDHTGDFKTQTGPVIEQLDVRLKAVQEFLASMTVDLKMIMARSGPLRPLRGGVYLVDGQMIADLESARYANHASNLAALIGVRLGKEYKVSTYIADPITTDELEPLARISGVPQIERKSRSHALNIKATTRKVCQRSGVDYYDSNWIVGHLGGGISVAALRNGRIIDVNDALLGMGPFSPERAGALPISGLLDLAFSGEYDWDGLDTLLSRQSGLKGYLDTADLREVETRIQNGDKKAELIFDAMVYQIAKEIAAMASVVSFQVNGVLLTGGMAHSEQLCEAISGRVQAIASVYIEAGENELEALAEAGFRVLLGEEQVLSYGPVGPNS